MVFPEPTLPYKYIPFGASLNFLISSLNVRFFLLLNNYKIIIMIYNFFYNFHNKIDFIKITKFEIFSVNKLYLSMLKMHLIDLCLVLNLYVEIKYTIITIFCLFQNTCEKKPGSLIGTGV
jgi:hypothetical protein